MLIATNDHEGSWSRLDCRGSVRAKAALRPTGAKAHFVRTPDGYGRVHAAPRESVSRAGRSRSLRLYGSYGRMRNQTVAKIPTSRVDKLLSSMGYGSRNEIARMAKRGGISLDAANLLDVTKRIPVTPDLPARMKIDGEALDPLPGMVILLNKPLDMTCSHKEDGPLVYNVLPERWKRRDPAISTIGRLDKQTSGLLLLTDDGGLLHRVISPKRHVAKIYRAKLARPLNGAEGGLFSSGQLMLKGEDKPLTPVELEVVSETEALLSVTEGRYHQVRRMFAATGNQVEKLHRERMGGLSLPDGMAPCQWKLLSEEEIALIFQERCDRSRESVE